MKHIKAKRADYRESSTKRGYDANWRRLKRAVRVDTAICEMCWRNDQRAVQRQADDHIIPFKGIDDPLRLDALNVRGLCSSHHTSKTHRDNEIRAYYDSMLASGLAYENARDKTIKLWRWVG